MLKPEVGEGEEYSYGQPPSGGCVLKHSEIRRAVIDRLAATFGWLCVETSEMDKFARSVASSHLRVAVC